MKSICTLLTILLLSGCSNAPQDPAHDPSVLLKYSRTGGFAPIREELLIQQDGAMSLRNGTRTANGTVPKEILDRLRSLLASPEFAALEPSYVTGHVADGITTTVEAAGKSVDTQGSHPAILENIIQECRQLISSMPG